MKNLCFLLSALSLVHSFVIGSGRNSLKRVTSYDHAKKLIDLGVKVDAGILKFNKTCHSDVELAKLFIQAISKDQDVLKKYWQYVENIEVAQCLIDCGAVVPKDILKTNEAWFSDAKLTELFLKHGADVSVHTYREITPLKLASTVEVAQCLIDYGAVVPKDILRTNKVWFSDAKLTELFLKHGADVDISFNTYREITPLVLASTVDVVDCLLRYGAKVQQDILCKNQACHGDVKMITRFKKSRHDLDLNCEFYQKNLLAKAKNIAVVRWLLRHGAKMQSDILVENEACHSNVKMMKIFLRHGAGASLKEPYKLNALRLSKTLAVIKCLLRNGARVNKDILSDSEAWQSNAKITELLIQHGADVHVNRPSLLSAVQNVEVAQCLIDHGGIVPCDILSRNSACERDVQLVDFFLNHGAGVDQVDQYNESFLDHNIQHHVKEFLLKYILKTVNPLIQSIDYDSAKKLIDNGVLVPSDIFDTNVAWRSNAKLAELFFKHRGESILHPSLMRYVENVEVAQCLLNYGVVIDQNILLCNQGCCKSVDLIKFFIQHGASHNVDECSRILNQAENVEVARYVYDLGKKLDSEFFAHLAPEILINNQACYKDAELLKFFVEHGADLHPKWHGRERPLMERVENVEVAEFLLSKGLTVVSYVLSCNHNWNDNVELLKFFIEHGAELKIQFDWDNKQLWQNVKNREVARFLLSKGARIDLDILLDNYRWCNNLDLTEFFIANGADVNARGVRGATPLHNAQVPEVVHCLLYHGADSKIKNDEQESCKNFQLDMDDLLGMQGRLAKLKFIQLYESFKPEFDLRSSLFAQAFMSAYLQSVQGKPEMLKHIMLNLQEKKSTLGRIESSLESHAFEEIILPELSEDVQTQLKLKWKAGS